MAIPDDSVLAHSDSELSGMTAYAENMTPGMTLPRLLCVQAHPDDETIWTGGTLARHCAAGGEADVVTTTWGIGRPRHMELVEALATLGLPRRR